MTKTTEPLVGLRSRSQATSTQERTLEHKARMLAEFEEEQSGVRRVGDWLITRKAGYSLYQVSHKGRTPKELDQLYTSFVKAEEAIDEYQKNKSE